MDVIEQLAIDRVKELFGAEYANVQPHSGSQANMAAYRALVKKGDKILGMDLNHGGHLTHGMGVNFSGQDYQFVSYGVNPETETIDYDELERIAKEEKPQLIVAGASAYPREIDFKRISEIAKEVGAYFMVDMAHIAGLVAKGAHQNPVPYADVVTSTTHKTLRGPRGAYFMVDMAHIAGLVAKGAHQNPVPYADVVTSTTHKTLRGPRGGLILAKEEFGKKLNSAIFPGIQGGPLEHVIAGKAVAFHEALQPAFGEYIEQVVKNAKAMAQVFEGTVIRAISGGTDNHLLLLDIKDTGLNGKEAQELLDTVGITVNKNAIPFDTLPPVKTSGIRVGTAAITTRGFDEAAAKKVAELILTTLTHPENEEVLNTVRQEVKQLTETFKLYA